MIKIWGRANSINVQKVLWCCGELGLRYERIDAGNEFGANTTTEYRALDIWGEGGDAELDKRREHVIGNGRIGFVIELQGLPCELNELAAF